jgi:hypothetical protein
MVELEPVDAVEVTLVVDNFVDVLLAGAEGVRPPATFHLTGAVFEPIIEPTVAAFASVGVERVVPGHCTGWKATHRLAQALRDAFVQPSVGTVLRF